MKRAGIIGLGTITKYYLEGLEASTCLELVATCDLLPRAASRKQFFDYEFYTDYKEMIAKEDLEYLIISTPPASHYEIAMYAMEQGLNVIVEKPAVTNLSQYEELMKKSQEKQVIFEVVYHWQNGSEVISFNNLFDTSKITEIGVTVLDPYSDDGVTINEDKVKLCGAWIDSGVNSLSMIKTWLSFETLEVLDVEVQRCEKTDLPIYAKANLVIDGVKTSICIDWRQGINRKESYVVLGGERYEIKHSDQSIIDGFIEMKFDDMERLAHHYYNYFKNYEESVDAESSYRIHKFLLEVNDKL